MLDKKKKGSLDLSVRIILSEAGVDFFMKNNKPLRRFKMADGRESYGISMRSISPASLQHMLLIGYISKIEMSRPEFVSSRSDVMDLSKLIVYGFLYNQFDETVFEKILASKLIQNWNRANPQNIIDSKTSFSKSFLQKKLREKQGAVQQVRSDILRPLQGAITREGGLLMEEKNTQIFLCERYLKNLRAFVWFILSRFQGEEDYRGLLREIQEELKRFVEKARIAEYLSLMLMEFLINAENSNIRQFAEKKYQGTIAPEKLQYEEEIREKVLEAMRREGENLTLLWKLGGDKNYSIGTRNRLQIMIFNQDSEVLAFKEKVDSKMDAGIQKMSLTEFFGDDSGGSSELGLYYLSYLSEECEKVDIRLDSLVNEDPATGQAVVTFNLGF